MKTAVTLTVFFVVCCYSRPTYSSRRLVVVAGAAVDCVCAYYLNLLTSLRNRATDDVIFVVCWCPNNVYYYNY